jgi:sugar phosphate permease
MIADRHRRWIILLTACLLFVLSMFYRASVAVITPDLIRDLGLDARGLSLISAAFFYAFAFMQIPISMYLDGIGPRISMTVLSIVAVAGALIFAWGECMPTLVIGRIFLGAGMACNLMGTFKLIASWFSPSRFATLSALVISIGTAGNITAATPLVLAVQAIGWRWTFTGFAVINLLLALLFFSVVRDRPPSAGGGDPPPLASMHLGDILRTLRQLLGARDYWIISLGTFCRYGIFASVQALWAGPYLMNVIQLPAVTAGNLILLMSVGIIVGSPVFGWLSDAVFNSRKGIIVVGLSATGLVLVILAGLGADASTAVLAVLFFGFGFFSSSGGIMYAHIKERMPAKHAATAMTGVNFFTMVGVVVFLQGLGTVMHFLFPQASLGAAAFKGAFLICSACLAVTVVCYLFTVDTRHRRLPPADR